MTSLIPARRKPAFTDKSNRTLVPVRIGRYLFRGGAIVALGLVAAFASVAAAPRISAAPVACDAASLVTALAAVSGSGQSGTVTLTAGCTYTMTAVDNTADGENAFPDILGTVTVIGNGATITRSTATGTPSFRFFMVDDGGSLDLSDVTLSNGSIPSSDVHGGGAILNRSLLTVTGVNFTNNSSMGSTGGGAIDNHDKGQLTVVGSTFNSNVGLQGGAIEDEGTLCHTSTATCASSSVTNSTFTNNSTTQFGGGAVEAQLDSSVTGSPPVCTGTYPWPVMPCQEPGGAHVTLIGDTFTGNTAATEGGALANFGTTTVTNSTLNGNAAGSAGGGGIQNTWSLAIVQTTIAGNTAPFGANVHNFTDTNQPGPPTTTFTMSIVSGGVTGTNCSGSVAMTDGGYNLDDGTSCGFSNNALNSTDPKLGALASNGGPTQTMALQGGSPAIDVIPSGFSGCSGSTDQRGVSRPQNGSCDIGAFEVSTTPPPDTTPPSVPTGLTAASTKTPQVDLSWNASTDNVGVTGYTIYRNGSTLTTVSGTTLSYSDLDVTQTTTYTYTVDAFDAAANHSGKSASASATTPDITAPSVPTGLSATGTAVPSVLLSWHASADNVGVVGYTIYRNGTMLTTVAGTTLTFTDTTVFGSTSYSYAVDAFDAAQNHSAKSVAATTSTLEVMKALGGGLSSAPDAVSVGSNQTAVFVRGSDNALWYRMRTGATWTGWQYLGGVLASAPSAVSWGPNRIDVFVRGGDNALWDRTWNGTTWSGWQSLGGIITSAPDAASWGIGNLEVFGRGGDGSLWLRSWNGTSWNGWQPLGGILKGEASAVSTASNRMDVFVRGGDDGLWERSWNGTAWTAWQAHGGVISADPNAISTGSGRLDVFVRGGDNALWLRAWNGTSWSWQYRGGTLKSAPEAVSCTAGHADVFIIGADNGLWQLGFDGTSWHGFRPLGGQWSYDPSAICESGQADIFVRSISDGLWETTYPAS